MISKKTLQTTIIICAISDGKEGPTLEALLNTALSWESAVQVAKDNSTLTGFFPDIVYTLQKNLNFR